MNRDGETVESAGKIIVNQIECNERLQFAYYIIEI